MICNDNNFIVVIIFVISNMLMKKINYFPVVRVRSHPSVPERITEGMAIHFPAFSRIDNVTMSFENVACGFFYVVTPVFGSFSS